MIRNFAVITAGGAARQNMSDAGAAYDRIAAEYARHLADELQHKPLDRELLNRFSRAVFNSGLVCDIGTGPGQVARYLHEKGVQVCGIDLSAEMVERARQLNPEIEFRQGDMFALDLADETFGGMTAFYAVVNLARESLVRALRELHRVLKPGGLLLLSFHIGEETLHRDEMWGVPTSLDFYFFGVEEMKGYLRVAGFNLREVIEREPYPEVEHPSRRAYMFARKPTAAPGREEVPA